MVGPELPAVRCAPEHVGGDDELADEMRMHLELRRQALIDGGMDPREAEYEARRLFGNPTVFRERARDA